MLGGVSHAFFVFFWPISLISSRWAHEVAPQEFAWVGCSKPSCFTRFWAGSGCGGLAGTRAWGALGASPGASEGLSGPLGGPPGPPRRTTEEAQAAPGRVFEGLWASTRFWAGSGRGGLAGTRAWGALGASPGASEGLSGPLGGPPGPPRRTTEEAQAAPGRVFEGLWASTGQPLGGSGDLRGLLRLPPMS